MDEVRSETPERRKRVKNELYISVVPWRNPEQFHKVYKYLYDPNIYKKRWAVDQISVWETRCYPALPTAIEATVVIVRASIQDMLFLSEKTYSQEKDIQMLFAMALIRFVNLMLEVDQNAQHKTNLFTLAEKRNFPKWIVDLRHDATHALLPSIPVLRIGCKVALEFLEDTYWKIEAVNIRPLVNTPSDIEESIKNVLSNYKNVRLQMLKRIDDDSEKLEDLKELLAEIKLLVKSHKKKFVDMFVLPGIFLCENALLEILELEGLNFLDDDDDLVLPDVLEVMWRPVIRIFYKFELIPYFMEVLLLSQKGAHTLCQKVATAWAMYLLHATSKKASRSALSERFQEKGVQLDLYRLLFACMKWIHKYTYPLFNMITNRIGGNKERFEEMCYVIALYQGATLPINAGQSQKLSLKDSIVFTLDDFLEDLEEAKKLKGIKKNNNIWSLAPADMNFSDMPLGAVINPDIEEETECMPQDVVKDLRAPVNYFHLIESHNQEPEVEARLPDNNIFNDPEIGSMLYGYPKQSMNF